MSEVPATETLGFQAEVKQLLHLMVHSLYGNKEIFLRELISNASDACDKLRFEALADQALWENAPDLKIRVSIDKAARTITISDNGIGMSRDEVIQNIGTIAKSGTREFFQSLTGDQAKDANLIGQFGVGLLLFVHRRGQGHARHAPRRHDARARRALGKRRPGRVHPGNRRPESRAVRTSSCTCATTRTSCWRVPACAPSFASTPITSRFRS